MNVDTVSPARDFSEAKQEAYNLKQIVLEVRETKPDAETLALLKPAEELLSFYEVDPGPIPATEIKETAEVLMVALAE